MSNETSRPTKLSDPPSHSRLAFHGIQPLPVTIDKRLTPALLYVFDQPLSVSEANRRLAGSTQET